MEQHAIPQQISSYEFKLVGEMTLKQFLKAAAGIVMAVMINATGLIFFVKYPLMLLFGAGGLMIAFVPFQDRPLETWIIAFIKAVYSPTIYTYKKVNDRNWLELRNTVQTNGPDPKNEKEDDVVVPVRDRKKVDEFINSLPSVKRELTTEDNQIELKREEIRQQISQTEEARNDLKVTSETLDSRIENKTEEKETTKLDDYHNQSTGLDLKKEKLVATGVADFGSIPMPDKPGVPNIIVGMVTDVVGKIIEGVIVEVQDQKGNPTRVLKTNSLGQFKTTSPLANGKYLIIPEKENVKFDRVEVTLSGQIVEPIRIKEIK
ncbi:PrgI family protein [Candidatus Shapirobacteria bacterium]|nr:PrgI family protein [Candidatus Shapirobacteria bacterium]